MLRHRVQEYHADDLERRYRTLDVEEDFLRELRIPAPMDTSAYAPEIAASLMGEGSRMKASRHATAAS